LVCGCFRGFVRTTTSRISCAAASVPCRVLLRRPRLAMPPGTKRKKWLASLGRSDSARSRAQDRSPNQSAFASSAMLSQSTKQQKKFHFLADSLSQIPSSNRLSMPPCHGSPFHPIIDKRRLRFAPCGGVFQETKTGEILSSLRHIPRAKDISLGESIDSRLRISISAALRLPSERCRKCCITMKRVCNCQLELAETPVRQRIFPNLTLDNAFTEIPKGRS
jgi:hypothetical protein